MGHCTLSCTIKYFQDPHSVSPTSSHYGIVYNGIKDRRFVYIYISLRGEGWEKPFRLLNTYVLTFSQLQRVAHWISSISCMQYMPSQIQQRSIMEQFVQCTSCLPFEFISSTKQTTRGRERGEGGTVTHKNTITWHDLLHIFGLLIAFYISEARSDRTTEASQAKPYTLQTPCLDLQQ